MSSRFEFLAADPFPAIIKQPVFLLSRIVHNLVLFDARLAQTSAVAVPIQGQLQRMRSSVPGTAVYNILMKY